ncbi:hypothetical protein [Roseibium album]|uniref:hypothetical protein n=1 Tax=Roseibium album TaxID=311410 RepID=UPI003297831E
MPDLVALLFGALIIGVFSYERFNKATYGGRRQLERLVDLLTPDKLRARKVVFHAYTFYALTMLMIYFFLCAYAEVIPYLGGPDIVSDTVGASQLPTAPTDDADSSTTGFVPLPNSDSVFWAQPLSSETGPSEKRNFLDIGIDPSISLTIALIIVGLAPTFPILQRFEDWMRSAAHRLAGIPTRVIGAGEDLQRNSIQIRDAGDPGNDIPKNSLLIPRGHWERITHYSKAAEGQLADPQDFHEDLDLIFAISSWILDRKLKLANASQREEFDKLEAALTRRRDVLLLELDEKSSYQAGETLSSSEHSEATLEAETPHEGNGAAENSASREKKRASWERLAEHADHLADDLCILLALYVEHEIIISEATHKRSDKNTPSSVRQQILAKEKLEAFLSELLNEHAGPVHSRSHAMLTILWSAGITILLAVAWSIFPGPYESALQSGTPGNPYWRALGYATTSFNSFCIPIIIALALRDGARQTHRWRNMSQSHWTKKLPQALLLVFISWAVATLFIIGLVLWRSAIESGGWSENQRTVWTTLRSSFEYNAPTPLRGAVLALILVVLLDAASTMSRSAVAQKTQAWSRGWAIRAAIIMGLCGGATRFLTSWASALNRSAEQPQLDAIDHGLIAYAAIYSSILGFLVVFCIAEALQNQRRRQSGAHAKASQSTGHAPAKSRTAPS